MEATARPRLRRRRLWSPHPQRAQLPCGPEGGELVAGSDLDAAEALRRREGRLEIPLEVELARDPRPCESDLARRAGDVGDRARATHDHRGCRRVTGNELAPVPEPH